jgi:integrase
MPTIRKRGDRWQAQVFKRGIRVSNTFGRKIDAVTWATKVEASIEAGTYGTPASDTFAAVADRYANEVSTTKRGARWEQIRLRAIVRDARFSTQPISQISPEDIGRWRDDRLRIVGPATVRREITLLTGVFEHARREWRLVTTNPLRDVRKPPNPKHRDRLPSEDEIDRICRALGHDAAQPVTSHSQQVAVAWLIAIETAMRAGEIITLTWDQVDLPRRVARLDKTKNGDKRTVPLSSRAIDLFMSLRPIDPARCFTVGSAARDTLFRRARDAAGVPDLHFHDARALALTRLASRLDVLELARMVGHRDPKSLMIYYRESAESIALKLG